MDVAYDKLKMRRPASEPEANLGTFTDQPMLDLMTQKAIEVLSAVSGTPFILMVEELRSTSRPTPIRRRGPFWIRSSSIRRSA